MNEKLNQGTNYVKEKGEEAKDYVKEKKMETEEYVQEHVEKTKDLLKKQWDAVYATTMYIPSKAIKITGEVFVSTREIIFAYAQVKYCLLLFMSVVNVSENDKCDSSCFICICSQSGLTSGSTYFGAKWLHLA